MHQEIKNNLIIVIDPSLVENLLDEYNGIKKYHALGEHETAILKSGKFVEIVFQILEYLRSGNVISKPNINNISKDLINTPAAQLPESIRITIPRSANAIYTIRSRRGAAHKSDDISPNVIDCEFVVSTCNWILSELLRLYHDSDIQKVKGIVNTLVEKKVPLIEEFEDDICILDKDMSTKDQILVILYHFHPKMVSNADLTKWTKGYPQKTTTNLKNAEKERLIHRNGRESTITRLGIKKVEEILAKRENNE